MPPSTHSEGEHSNTCAAPWPPRGLTTLGISAKESTQQVTGMLAGAWAGKPASRAMLRGRRQPQEGSRLWPGMLEEQQDEDETEGSEGVQLRGSQLARRREAWG